MLHRHLLALVLSIYIRHYCPSVSSVGLMIYKILFSELFICDIGKFFLPIHAVFIFLLVNALNLKCIDMHNWCHKIVCTGDPDVKHDQIHFLKHRSESTENMGFLWDYCSEYKCLGFPHRSLDLYCIKHRFNCTLRTAVSYCCMISKWLFSSLIKFCLFCHRIH